MLLGLFFIFVVPKDYTNASKLLGVTLLMTGVLIGTWVHSPKITLPLNEKLINWAKERHFFPAYADEEVMNFEKGKIHIHYKIETQHIKIYAETGRRLVFNGKLHYIGQLDNLLEMIY